MLNTRNGLSSNVRGRSIDLIGGTLLQLVDLERQAKQAHWNVKGPEFIALHELLDRLSLEVRDLADTVAERIVTLGGRADARSQTVARGTALPEYPLGLTTAARHIEVMADAIASVGDAARKAIDQATGWNDAVTADILTDVSRALDKQLWLVEAHLAA